MSMNFPFDHDQPDNGWDETTAGENESPLAFDLMMSLALDDLLDDDELAQFHEDIEYYPLLANQWATWQDLDEKLLAEPSVMPPIDFVQNFEMRLIERTATKKILVWGNDCSHHSCSLGKYYRRHSFSGCLYCR